MGSCGGMEVTPPPSSGLRAQPCQLYRGRVFRGRRRSRPRSSRSLPRASAVPAPRRPRPFMNILTRGRGLAGWGGLC